jgi:hypothetical protein
MSPFGEAGGKASFVNVKWPQLPGFPDRHVRADPLFLALSAAQDNESSRKNLVFLALERSSKAIF